MFASPTQQQQDGKISLWQHRKQQQQEFDERKNKLLQHVAQQIQAALQHDRILDNHHVTDGRSFFVALDKQKPRRGALTREEIVNGLRRLDVAVDDSLFNMLVTTKDENQNGLIELHGFLLALNRAAGTMGAATQATGTSEGTATLAVAAVEAGAQQCDQGFLNLYQQIAAAGNPQQAAAQSQHVGTYQNPQQAAAAGNLAAIAGNPQQAAAQSQQVGTYPHPQQTAASGYLAAIAGNPQLAAAQSQQVGTYPYPQQTAASSYLAAIAGNPQLAAAQSQQVGTNPYPQQTTASGYLAAIAGNPQLAAAQSQQVGTYPHPQQTSVAGYLAAIAGNPQLAAAQSQQVGTYPHSQQTAAAGYLAATAGNPQLAAAQSQQVGTYQNPQQAAPHHQVPRSTSMVITHPMQPSGSHVQYESASPTTPSFDQESFYDDSSHPDSQLILPRKKGKPSGHGTSRANSKIPKVPRSSANSSCCFGRPWCF
ncbi:unnamed protein product [Polarella glacialis]|uniref:EF-hand domain-containing protein n=1 Tax=Polarella glacialis TaxID=89957 RepID=A0A813FWD6_POLGL|nr:unnamed protein product [Polarella glacialis]